jgi:4-amino-4-deoxy-L-arabinose transferase-like glycosyltransferase
MRFRSSFKPWWTVDGLLLIGLTAYILAGVPLTTYHGDEGMQVFATQDYITAFIDGSPSDLLTEPPYTIDSRPYLRIINGSVQRYAAGWVLHLRGHNAGDLPREPGWNWGLNYPENVAGGWLPKDSVLFAARYTSATFFALSVIPMFAMGILLGGRWAAYPAAILYALNPILLLNGRRAMMEGSLLLFGLLTLWLALIIVKQIQARQDIQWWHWTGLAMCGGLTLASKHSGAIFLIGAWAWVGLAILWTRQYVVKRIVLIVASGAVAVGLFVGLSPALWNNPPARLADLVRLRSELLSIQVAIEADAPTKLTDRAVGIITQPFIAPLAHFERPDWNEVEPIAAQVAAYDNLWLRGLPTTPWIGIPLTILALIGAVILIRRQPTVGVGLLLCYALTALALMGNPLPWQRYVIPLIPLVILLTSAGFAWSCEKTRTASRLPTNRNG